jgi:heme-degrading monooxygenase HmoA
MIMAQCTVLIRRFVKTDRADDFIASFQRRAPVVAEGFLGKTLTRLDDSTHLPAGLTGFHLAGNPGCVTFVTVELWKSEAAFRAYVPNASTNDQDEFEAAPRQRVILTDV